MSIALAHEKVDRRVTTAFLRQMGWVAISLLCIRFLPLIAQGTTAQISGEYLTAISLLSHLLVVSIVVGTSLGSPLLVLTGRFEDENEHKKLLGSVFFLGVVCNFICAVLLLLCKQPILSGLGIHSIESIETAYYLTIMVIFVRTLNSISYCALISTHPRFLVFLEVIVNLVMATGSFYSVFRMSSPAEQFTGIVFSSFAAELTYLVFTLGPLKKNIKFDLTNTTKHWHRCKQMITSDSINLFFSFLYPLILSVIFLQSTSKEAVAALNVGFRLTDILLVPASAVLLSGSPWLASLWRNKHTVQWDKRIKLLYFISFGASILGLIATLPFLKFINNYFFGLTETSSLLIVGVLLLSVIPNSITGHLETQYAVCEKQNFLARTGLFTNYLVGIPLTYLFVKLDSIVAASACAILIPLSFNAYWLYIKRDMIGEARRHTPRFKIPSYLDAAVSIKNISNPITLQLLDLGMSGCAVKDHEPCKIGQIIEGNLLIQDNVILKFSGVIKNRMDVSEGFFVKKKSTRLGIAFTHLTPHNKALIISFLDNLSTAPAKKAA